MFRLTHVDRSSGMWTAIIKVEAGIVLPTHFHYGEVQIYALEGEIAVDDVWLRVGDYFLDSGGQSRRITAGPDGATYFVMYGGGLSAVGSDGKPEGA
jgi:anti-sigma factor ChrR (cupin superfamily)